MLSKRFIMKVYSKNMLKFSRYLIAILLIFIVPFTLAQTEYNDIWFEAKEGQGFYPGVEDAEVYIYANIPDNFKTVNVEFSSSSDKITDYTLTSDMSPQWDTSSTDKWNGGTNGIDALIEYAKFVGSWNSEDKFKIATLKFDISSDALDTDSFTLSFDGVATYKVAGEQPVSFNTEDLIIDLGSGNTAPVLTSIGAKSVPEGGTLTFTVSATDDDGNTLIFSATELPSGATFDPSARTFSWTPGFGDSGYSPYTITFTVSDGTLTDFETVTITVGGTNQAPEISGPNPPSPVSIDEGQSVEFSVTASDPDGETLYYSWTVDDGSVGEDYNTYTFISDYTTSGTYSIKVVVSDPEGLSDSQSWILNVGNVNFPPQIVLSQSSVDINEGETVTVSDYVTVNDPEGLDTIENGNIMVVYSSYTATTINPSDGTWTVGYEKSGSHNILITATDTGGSTTAVFVVHVGNTNRAPVSIISSPADDSVQYINNIVLIKTDGSGDPDEDTNGDNEIWASEDNSIYVWDFGKRKEPWGKMQIPAGGGSPTCVGVGNSCTTGYLMLGTQIPQQGGNPCVCLENSRLHTAEDGYRAGGVLHDEYYIYEDSSVDIVEASNFNLRAQIDRYVQYNSLDACDGWDGTGYTDGASCEVTLTVFDSEGAAGLTTRTFSLSQTDNKAPVIISSPDKTSAVDGEAIIFDASQTYDPDRDLLGFTWEFGDGATAIGQTVTHSYSEAGTYTAILRVSDGKTTTSSVEETIIILLGERPTARITSPYTDNVNLGKQLKFEGTGTAPPGSNLMKLIWDFGTRANHWGEVRISNNLFVCEKSDGTQSCSFGEFETIDGSTGLGTPCACDEVYPYKEFNIYPDSVVSLDTKQPLLFAYSSLSQCADYGQEVDNDCDVSLVTQDSKGRFSPKAVIRLTLTGLPGDLNADASINQEDSNILYNLLVGEVKTVEGNPDCDGDKATTINDFVLLNDRLLGDEDKCMGGSNE